MKKYILIGLLLGFMLRGYSQKVDKIEFVNYDKVIGDIFASVSFTELKTKWDYESILLLDSTSIERINEIRPDIVTDFRHSHSYPILEKYKKILSIDVKSIKDCFKNETLLNLILTNTTIESDFSDKKLHMPIYIKDDKMAVYNIYGQSWSECNRITLIETGVLIEMIYIIQE